MSPNIRAELTPHMTEYDAQFSDSGETRWLPYIMYFHPSGYRSEVVNTDSLGFRYAIHEGRPVSVDNCASYEAVNVLAGSSTVFGIGASSDAATLASRLNYHNGGQSGPWLNFGGRSHNSAQEAILYALTKHRLPMTERIVLFSGFNDLGLARLPISRRLEGGAFFLCNTFFDRLTAGSNGETGLFGRRRPRLAGAQSVEDRRVLDLGEQIGHAADLVLRHLDVWRALAADVSATLTYVLQPLAGWVREGGTQQETALFRYLDNLGRFNDTYGEIARPDVGHEYAQRLGKGCASLDVAFVDFTPLLAAGLTDSDWMFVDRIHFTDFGYDLAAKLLVDEVLGAGP